MHETIAKARIKGTFRVANNVLDSYNEDALSNAGTRGRWSRKTITSFVQNICDMYGDLLLFHKMEKRKSSWHFDSINFAINPDWHIDEELGTLHCIICEKVATRLLRKGVMPYQHLSSKCFVHEHFLQRLSQRDNELNSQSVKCELLNIVMWLNDFKPVDNVECQKLHFVMSKKVVVVTYHQTKDIFIFNTVLLREQFTLKQAADTERAYSLLDSSDADCVSIALTSNKHSSFKWGEQFGDPDFLTKSTIFHKGDALPSSD